MINAGLLSKGTTLSYIENGNIKTVAGVKSIPTVGSDPEKVDVTNLGSSKKRYVKGLQDTDNLEFSVIYKGENFKDIHRLVELDKPLEWLVMYPDGMTVRFTGEVMQKIDGVEVNAAIGFSIVIVVSEGPSIEFAKEPSRPTALKASNVQFDQFNLSWNGSGLFRIYVDRNNVGETYNNTFTVTGLKPSSKHIVSVAGVSGVNEAHTVPITVTTTELPKITKINVPQRLDLYVDETKQLDVSTVPIEAMRAYEHANKAVLDSSVVKIDGDKITGVSDVNDESLGRNLLKNSEKEIKSTEYKIGTWWPSTPLIAGEKYNFMAKVKVPEQVEILRCFLSNSQQVVLVVDVSKCNDDYCIINQEFKAVYRESATPEDDINNSVFTIFRAKNEPLSENVRVEKLSISKAQKTNWTPAPEDGYSYTSANVTFNDGDKSSTEFDIFVHKRERMTSPTKADTASFVL